MGHFICLVSSLLKFTHTIYFQPARPHNTDPHCYGILPDSQALCPLLSTPWRLYLFRNLQNLTRYMLKNLHLFIRQMLLKSHSIHLHPDRPLSTLTHKGCRRAYVLSRQPTTKTVGRKEIFKSFPQSLLFFLCQLFRNAQMCSKQNFPMGRS